MTLNLENVTLTYPDGEGRVTALDSVSLHVDRGELALVVGPSGSGKSSLLAVAATLIPPDSGAVNIDGLSLEGLSPSRLAQLRREQIGIVFQQPNLLPSLTTLEQLQVMGHLGRPSQRVERAEAMDLLEAVGMAEYADRRPGQLSGGQRQRVNIARALVHRPAVLLVDEPTSALDHERGEAIMDLVRRVTVDKDTATVLVTHDTAQIHPGERVVECHDGRLSERSVRPARVAG